MIKFISSKTYTRMTKYYNGTKIIKKDKIIIMAQNPIYIKSEFKDRIISFLISPLYILMPIWEFIKLVWLLIECLPVIAIVNKPDEVDMDKRTEADPTNLSLYKNDDSETVEREQV